MIFVKEGKILRSECDIIINLTDVNCNMSEELSRSLLKRYKRLDNLWGRGNKEVTRFIGLFEVTKVGTREVAKLLSYNGIDNSNTRNLDMFTRALSNFLVYLDKNKFPKDLKVGLPYNFPLDCGLLYYKIITELFEYHRRDVYLYKK